MRKLEGVLFTLLLILTPTALTCYMPARAQEIASNPSDIEFQNDWTLLNKIDESEAELKNLQLKISNRYYTHKEARIEIGDGGEIKARSEIILRDVEKEIGLQLLDLRTGHTNIVIITKRGKDIVKIEPEGFEVGVVKRVNGIEWNWRNTQFKVLSPENQIVLKIAWPVKETCIVITDYRDKNGINRQRRRTEQCIVNKIYTPFSGDDPNTEDLVESGIHTPKVIEGGAEDLENIIKMACKILEDRGVRSKAFPEYFVCDLPFLSEKAYQRLTLIEQMDMSEFYYNSRTSFERVLVIFRGNRGRAFPTCNSAGACGAWQFTNRTTRDRRGRIFPGTYTAVTKSYPNARLTRSFPIGAFDHINASMAAILLHDSNLKVLKDEFGQIFIEKIRRDPVFTELVLAAIYNTTPARVKDSLKGTRDNNFEGWEQSPRLLKETKGYITKNKYLIENDLP